MRVEGSLRCAGREVMEGEVVGAVEIVSEGFHLRRVEADSLLGLCPTELSLHPFLLFLACWGKGRDGSCMVKFWCIGRHFPCTPPC